MKIFAETDRLILREVLHTDKLGLFQLDSDADVHKYLGNNPIKNEEEVNVTIEYIRQQYIENGIGRWAVVEKKTNNFIGWTGFKLVKESINEQSNFYELGYRLIKQYWGQGYATETANASLQYGFDTMNLEEIFAMTDVRNKDSQRVLTKVGLRFVKSFDYNGIEHNWYKIGRNEWNLIRT